MAEKKPRCPLCAVGLPKRGADHYLRWNDPEPWADCGEDVLLAAEREASRLSVVVVYENPRDYPGKFVVRRWWCLADGLQVAPERDPIAVVDTLSAAEAAVPDGRIRMQPHANDDACIVQVWL